MHNSRVETEPPSVLRRVSRVLCPPWWTRETDKKDTFAMSSHRGPGLSKARPLPAIPDSPHRPSLWQAAGGGALCVGIPGVRQAPSAPSCHPGPEPPTRRHAESSRHGSRTAAARTPLGI